MTVATVVPVDAAGLSGTTLPIPGGAELVCCLLIGLGLLLWPDRESLARTAIGHTGRWARRLGRSGERRPRLSPRTRRAGLWAIAALAVGLLVGIAPVPMVVATALAAAAGWWLPARESSRDARRRDHRRETADTAALLDLLAAALESGLAMPSAIAAATQVDDCTAAGVLREVGHLLVLGAAPAQAWAPATVDGDLAAVATAAVRSAIGGLTVADAARAAATDLRARARAMAERSAARAEVAMTAPLAVCFLPAFLCLGLAPVVIGLVTGLHLF